MTGGQFWKTIGEPALVVLALGTFLAILGPYGSGALGWPWVWLYWTGLIAFGLLCGVAAGALIARLAPGWPQWLQYLAAVPAVSIPVTVAVSALNAVFEGGIDWPDIPLTFFLVMVITLFVTGVTYAVDQLKAKPDAGGSAAPSPALTDKLPLPLKTAPVHALQSEDHYLRVHTARGDALILMRLSDAIAAVSALEGAQSHRSWWVARDAVIDVKKADGRATLTLEGGQQAPVSRTFYPKLREAGWL